MRQLPTAVRAKRRVGRPKRLINGGRAEITYEHDRYERRGVSALGSTSRGAFALLEATDLLPMLILPIITKNYANASSAQVSKWEAMRRNKERHNTRALVSMLVARTPFPEGVRTVLFERSSPGIMDSDGCSSAVKSVRDAVAAWRSGVDVTAGRGDDSPACGVEWTYASVRSKDYGVRVILLW